MTIVIYDRTFTVLADVLTWYEYPAAVLRAEALAGGHQHGDLECPPAEPAVRMSSDSRFWVPESGTPPLSEGVARSSSKSGRSRGAGPR